MKLDSAMDLQVLTVPPQFSDATGVKLEPCPLLGLRPDRTKLVSTLTN